jgi:uncharacterized protein
MKQRGGGKRNNAPFGDFSSSHVKITPIPRAGIKLDRPIMIAGFADKGLVGSICINHIVEQLQMHQIGYIESQYVMPAALFVGRRFRHPFRLYANNTGKICALITEMPILVGGALSLANTITDWAVELGFAGIIVTGGILQGNFSPAIVDGRKALLLENELDGDKNSAGGTTLVKANDTVTPDSALLPGMAGALLTSCAARNISCKAIMVPTIGDLPDPEGSAIVLESLNKVVPGLSIDTSGIRKEIEIMKQRLQEYMKLYEQHLAEYEQNSSRTPSGGIYK